MARTQDGEYYYDAGTINEQLEDYEVYEQDGRLYLNKEGADPEAAISFDGVSQILQGARAEPAVDELDGTEHMIYVDSTSGSLAVSKLDDPEADEPSVETAEIALTFE